MARKIETLPQGQIVVGARTVPLSVRVDARAKRLTLRLTEDGGARVTCPSRRHVRDAVAMAQARAAWIEQRLQARPRARPLSLDETLYVLGQDLRIVAADNPRAAARIVDGRIVTGGENDAAVARRVEALLRREAQNWFLSRANYYAAALALPPCPVSVREMRTRWGSCSAAPALSFNWRLIFAPLSVADYVAVHEAAHRRHMNHSPAFWSVVEELCPDYRRQSDWLRAHGATLHAYGA